MARGLRTGAGADARTYLLMEHPQGCFVISARGMPAGGATMLAEFPHGRARAVEVPSTAAIEVAPEALEDLLHILRERLKSSG